MPKDTRDDVDSRVDDTGDFVREVVFAHEEDESDADEGEDGHVEEDADDGEHPERERELQNVPHINVLACARLHHTTHDYIGWVHALLSL